MNKLHTLCSTEPQQGITQSPGRQIGMLVETDGTCILGNTVRGRGSPSNLVYVKTRVFSNGNTKYCYKLTDSTDVCSRIRVQASPISCGTNLVSIQPTVLLYDLLRGPSSVLPLNNISTILPLTTITVHYLELQCRLRFFPRWHCNETF